VALAAGAKTEGGGRSTRALLRSVLINAFQLLNFQPRIYRFRLPSRPNVLCVSAEHALNSLGIPEISHRVLFHISSTMWRFVRYNLTIPEITGKVTRGPHTTAARGHRQRPAMLPNIHVLFQVSQDPAGNTVQPQTVALQRS
jgi:hypothetical protein